MEVRRLRTSTPPAVPFELLDERGQPVEVVSGFLRFLQARGYSPNTLSAYVYDLLHFMRFLRQQGLTYLVFRPAHSVHSLEYLRNVPTRRHAQRFGMVGCTTDGGQSARCLAPATINRILAAVASFYEYLILSDQLTTCENPLHQEAALASIHVADRHQPFIGRASRQRPIRRMVRVKTAVRLPRPLTADQTTQLMNSLRRWRDKAMILLMLQGGLRPGEVLNLHLEDIQYGRRRLVIRYRTDHPKGVRTKSRVERMVDLHEPEALHALSTYVMQERPTDAPTTLIFLVGGKGTNRLQPLSYQALVKLFRRHCERLGIRTPWVTPHALRHTHATKMWEGGMRELTLQKRLGHASPESTRIYTRVSDARVVADYRRALGQPPEAPNQEASA
jgi:integrase